MTTIAEPATVSGVSLEAVFATANRVADQLHLEEAFSFGEGVLPILSERGLLAETPTC